MKSKFITVKNFIDDPSTSFTDITEISGLDLQQIGENGLCIVRLSPHQKQKVHYHSYAEIDVFIVISGDGSLHLGKVQNNRVVPGSEEKIPLKTGDTYCVKPYVLHGVEAGSKGLTYLNIAHDSHGLSIEGEKIRRSHDVFFPME